MVLDIVKDENGVHYVVLDEGESAVVIYNPDSGVEKTISPDEYKNMALVQKALDMLEKLGINPKIVQNVNSEEKKVIASGLWELYKKHSEEGKKKVSEQSELMPFSIRNELAKVKRYYHLKNIEEGKKSDPSFCLLLEELESVVEEKFEEVLTKAILSPYERWEAAYASIKYSVWGIPEAIGYAMDVAPGEFFEEGAAIEQFLKGMKKEILRHDARS